MDPLGHCQAAAKYFPKNTIAGRILLPVQLAFDLFQGKEKDMAEKANKVTFYVMGVNAENAPGNYWTSLPTFPEYKPTPFYLAADRSISQKYPSAPTNISWISDPTKPVDTRGGHNLALPCGPLDQTDVEEGARNGDVLTFQTPPLEEPLAITGPINARVYVSSSANDTDVTAKLTVVHPDGTSQLITDGIARLRWRRGEHGGNVPQPLQPNEIYEANVMMLNTSFVFPKGYRIRVSIASSNYPRFSLNYNNFSPLSIQERTTPVRATNRLHFSGEHPSAIILPVVPLAALPERKFTLSQPSLLKTSHTATPFSPSSAPDNVCDVLAQQLHHPSLLVKKSLENPVYKQALDACGL